MKNLCVLFMAITLLYSCEKDDKQKDPSDCKVQMKEKFKKDLKCTENPTSEVNLYMGLYENKQVYFTDIICMSCGTMPPAYGYTCENEKVEFDDFRNVENVKEIYNGCTQEFIE